MVDKIAYISEFLLDPYEVEIGRQYIVDIPNMDREDLAGLFEEFELNRGAEIGVERGIYSEILCKKNPNLWLSCIDPWSAGAYEPGIFAVDPEQEKYDARYEETKDRLKRYNAQIIRKGSMEAVNDFDDGSLDFVYIDANHDFPNFINDLHQWSKKVRMGGIIAGHDYALFSYKRHNHVKRALDAYSRCYRMQPLFIVGRFEQIPGEKRDKYRSWFWIKDK